MTVISESIVEDSALDWLRGLGYNVLSAEDTSPGRGGMGLRSGYDQAVLEGPLESALLRLNPDLPDDLRKEAVRRLTQPEGLSLAMRNRAIHRDLVNGVEVEHRRPDGTISGALLRAIDFDDPYANDWIAAQQFRFTEAGRTRRMDIVLFVNGLPLAVLELKNPADENATIWEAHAQLTTYQAELPVLFQTNAAMVISDGVQARIGALGAGREWWKPWRTVRGGELAPAFLPELQVLIQGVFEKRRFLDLVRYFLVFEDRGAGPVKKMAGYHQFHAVGVALEETIRASKLQADRWIAEPPGRYEAGPQPGGEPGDRRIGVVWHTQGSGKSLTMAFYAGRVIRAPEMENPTLVVLTDRNDLDDQLFGTFARCRELLRQEPVQAASRADLRERLRVSAGGVVFTTIQKFLPDEKGDRHPLLSDRRNVVVIADEAHRSQYDTVGERGFAGHLRDALPSASFIGFTGTPIELADRSTRAVFGDTISVYDVRRAVQDGATVPIYYEGRLAKLDLAEDQRPRIDPDFEEVTEGEEVEQKERLKSKWAQLAAIVGADERLRIVGTDLVGHFERRLDALEGKGMIVCMSRRICVDLYERLAALRPDWIAGGEEDAMLRIVMTGSATDPAGWQRHIRTPARREKLAERFRDPADRFRLVIVRDMWLTGFDAPSLHTMYLDKPMRGHNLMQAIARVNRVFRDKPGGLVVDYLGLADELRQALATYTESGGTGRAAIDQEEAVTLLQEKHEICRGFFFGFDLARWASSRPDERLALLPAAQEHVLAQEDGKERYLRAVGDLSRAFALAMPADEALAIRDEVAFFQALKAVLAKGVSGRNGRLDVEHAIRQIVSRAVASEEVIDVFAAAGLKKPDLAILSDEFLTEVRNLPQRNLAVEMLRKLLVAEIGSRRRKNVVEARSFAELLDQALRRYRNRAIETAQVIEELIALAKQLRQAEQRGAALGLSEEELAFYDALETNDSAVQVLGEPALQGLARELVRAVRSNVTLDWTVRESVRAQLRVIVKRILRKHGYPPDKQERATQVVLEQAEVLSEGWTLG